MLIEGLFGGWAFAVQLSVSGPLSLLRVAEITQLWKISTALRGYLNGGSVLSAGDFPLLYPFPYVNSQSSWSSPCFFFSPVSMGVRLIVSRPYRANGGGGFSGHALCVVLINKADFSSVFAV